jgi:hypothetical protein
VSGAQVEVNEHDRRVEIRGGQLACDRADEYVKMVLDQRVGAVHIDMDTERADMTVVTVPRDCVGYVTGTLTGRRDSLYIQCSEICTLRNENLHTET